MKTTLLYRRLRWFKNLFQASLLLILASTSFNVLAQDPAQYGTPYAGVPYPMDVNLYQVNIRPFSAAGNLAGVTARLDNIKAVGTNVIYLMPVYPHGTDSKSSVSPYSIKDFTSVGSEYGSLTDLRALVDGAHSRGMAVILDFVVNGTSWDNAWITQHPDWYVRDGNGNIQQLATFPDVAALNFSNTAMRTAVINAMRYWIFAANMDGFRCDFANNPPIDFWNQAIGNLRSISSHKLLMFAEGDHQNLFQGGFDYSFGDQFYYNALKPIRKNGDNVNNDISNITNFEYLNATGSNQVIRYTDNHDVDGSGDGNALTIFGGPAGVMANYVVCAYMRGVPFLYGSQEVAFTQQIFWPYTGVKIDWSQNANVTAEFTKVNNYRTSSNAIRRGTMANYSDANVCAFTKTSGSEKVVVMVNLRSGSSSYTIPSSLAGSYKDAYSGATVTLTSGATQNLSGFQYLVYTNANVTPVAVTGVTVSPGSASIGAGLTQQLTATIAPANASNTSVGWSSSNTSVATVNAAGLVTAIAAGTASITVKTLDGSKTATSAITVTAGSSFTVYFSPPTGWGTGIKMYSWNALPTGVRPDGTWPGVNMTNNGNGWYSYTFTTITSTNLIFNDGSNQTANLNRSKTGWYINGTWYDTNPGTGGGSTTYYQIVNRYQANNYLYDAGNGKVAYGTNSSGNNYQWAKIDAGNGYYLLKNRATGNLMHVEDQNGNVECTTGNTAWYSAMWTSATATNGWSYIQNRYKPNEWINNQDLTGYAEYAGAQSGWYSAMWQFVNPVTGP